MAASSSPTVRRRRLASELHRLRQASKMTIEQVADALEWSPGKVSKIENARVSVMPRDARRLIDLYGIPEGDERELLLALARESRQKGWWQQYGQAVPDWFEVFVGLEAEAATITGYDAEFVPGILQTEDYAKAVHRAQLISATDDAIDRLVHVRMARQELLTSDDAPVLWLVLNEAVVRRVVGGPQVMHNQLKRLLDVSVLPNVTLQVVPFSAGAHPAMDGSFNLLSFPKESDPNIVYIEYHTGALYIERQEEVARYRLLVDHLRAAALSVAASRSIMECVADDLA